MEAPINTIIGNWGNRLTARRKLPETAQPGSARKYERVYEALRARVLSPDADESKPLATEESLTKEFGVSRVTVRKALKILEDQGLIVRRQRLGIFPVRRVVTVGTGSSVAGIRAQTEWLAAHSEVRLIACRRIVAPAEVQRRLQVGKDARVLKFERVRVDGAGALAHLTSYLIPPVANLVTRAELIEAPPLVLLPNKGIAIARTEQTISAESATEEMARWLGVDEGGALIRTTRLIVDGDGRAVSFMVARLRADRYELHYTLDTVSATAPAPQVWRIGAGQ